MPLVMRPYQSDDDYWRLRAFLREVFLRNDRREISWHVARLDYWRWNGVENTAHCRLEEVVFLWEAAEGHIAAALNPEGPGEAFLHIHPGWRTVHLAEEMLDVAEERLALRDAEGRRKLSVWANASDAMWQDLLARRGYVRGSWPETLRRRELGVPVPDVPVPEGYVVRALGDAEDLPARSWVSWKAFHPDEPLERYEGWTWYRNIRRCPLYRRDLDLVAVAPRGAHVAFCTVWFDDVTRSGYFEPVGTHPDHQRRGLGRAVVNEGLRRLQCLGATLAFVGGYSPAANALYGTVGFAEYDLLESWDKAW